MGIGKRTLIADILHYPIWLTPLEKRVLGTPIFNRLHNVNQNSTAYLTFPSINHSRLSHSLGTMSLTGQLFYYGVINADMQDLKKFLQSAKILIELLCREFDASQHPPLIDANCNPGDSGNFNIEFEEFSSLGPVIPHFLDKDDKYVFATLLQALRLAALSHDLGHPPFSHVTEYALLDARKTIVTTLNDQNSKQRQFIDCLKNTGTGTDQIYPHEKLTLILFKGLSQDVLTGSGSENKTPEQYCYAWLSLRMAANILSDGCDLTSADTVAAIEVLRCLHSLTAGDLDGDRLDYIQRDAVLAGIKDSGLRAERLIQLMRLTYVEVATKDPLITVNAPRIVPNVRSLRSLEEYFSARFELYRSVIFHHHVVRTDSLFQSIVKDLTIKFLNDDSPNSKQPAGANQHTLLLSSSKSDIAWLWLIFDEDAIKRRGQGQRNLLYLQWDDYWLLSLLRAMFIELHDKKTQRNEEDEILYRRLEELIASKRNYLSLVKRFEDFREIEISFFRELKRQFKDNSTLAGEDSTQTEDKGKEAKKELADKLLLQDDEAASERSLRLANKVCLAADNNPIHEGFEQEFCEDVGTKDVLLIHKVIKSGFGKDFLVQTDSGTRAFAEYSLLAKDLENKESRCPLFFAYVLKPITISSPPNLRKKLGEALAKNYIARCPM